jgi:hypothetical protein
MSKRPLSSPTGQTGWWNQAIQGVGGMPDRMRMEEPKMR